MESQDVLIDFRAPYFVAAEQYSLISSHYEEWSPINWYDNVRQQGKAYHEFLQNLGLDNSASVIDVTCGMGTQVIGLALHGYKAHGLDLAPGQIARAKKETNSFNLSIEPIWRIGDALHAKNYFDQKFEVVLSCGNSIPLLGNEEYVEKFCQSIKQILKPEGIFISILMDYSEIRKQQPYIIQKGTFTNTNRNGYWLETGLWHRNQACFRSDVIFTYNDTELTSKHYSFPSLYAIKPDEYVKLLTKAGFCRIEKLQCIDRAIPGFYSVVARAN